jgi:hypothetical protein
VFPFSLPFLPLLPLSSLWNQFNNPKINIFFFLNIRVFGAFDLVLFFFYLSPQFPLPFRHIGISSNLVFP